MLSWTSLPNLVNTYIHYVPSRLELIELNVQLNVVVYRITYVAKQMQYKVGLTL